MATHGYLDKLIVNNEQQEEHLRSTCVLFMCMFYKNNKNLIHIYFTFILLFLLSSSSSSPPPSSHCVHGYIYTIFGRGSGSSIILLLIYHITIHQHIDYRRGSCKQNDRGLPSALPTTLLATKPSPLTTENDRPSIDVVYTSMVMVSFPYERPLVGSLPSSMSVVSCCGFCRVLYGLLCTCAYWLF